MGGHGDKINGLKYWDQRFQANWVENHGQEQSRFFAAVALEMMPTWLVDRVREDRLSFCDWGCAMGDGTEVLGQVLGAGRLHGIDFSPIAVARAGELYPSISFQAVDLLAGNHDLRFDVIFSSNTLEHFEDPWTAADKLAEYAEYYLCFLVPFQEPEDQRHEEHFYTFDWKNIRRRIGEDFVLVDTSVVDVGIFPDPQWSGKQIFLTYARCRLPEELRSRMAEKGEDLLGRLGSHIETNERLVRDMASVAAAAADSKRSVTEGERAIADLGQQLGALRAEQDRLTNDLSVAREDGDRLAAALAASSRAKEEADRRIADLKRELMAAVRTREELGRQRDAAQKIVLEAERELSQVYASRSWRITSPFRFLHRLASK